MGFTAVFGDAGNSILGSFLKDGRLQWLPGWMFVFAIILRVLSQDRLFSHIKHVR
jgi:hypothetical protein